MAQVWFAFVIYHNKHTQLVERARTKNDMISDKVQQ